MGNQSTKENNIDEAPVTSRCPQRNRNIKRIGNERQRTLEEISNKASHNEGAKRKLTQNRSKIFESREKLQAQASNSSIQKPERNSESNSTLRRKRKVKKIPKESSARTVEEDTSDSHLRQTSNQDQRNASKTPTQQDIDIISDIFKTVAELQSTFIDEKKYERRLRTAFSNQMENMQHLELSLHVEKERNKRLMELMNRIDNPDLSAVTTESPEPSRADTSEWSYGNALSRTSGTPISSMLMQQRYGEVSKSYTACQTELRKKDHLLTMAICKQEELQAKCDRLTDKYLIAQRKIESLKRTILVLRKKVVEEEDSDSYDTDESGKEGRENCGLEIPNGVTLKYRMSRVEKDNEETGFLEDRMIVETEKPMSKAKEE